MGLGKTLQTICIVAGDHHSKATAYKVLNPQRRCSLLFSLPRSISISVLLAIFRKQGAVSRKSRELFGPEKPFVKLRPVYSVKLIFSDVVKGIKIEITAKFRASRRLRFEDTKRIVSPEIRPKRFGTFEKQAPGLFQLPCQH